MKDAFSCQTAKSMQTERREGEIMIGTFFAVAGLAAAVAAKAPQTTEDIVAAQIRPITWDGAIASGPGGDLLSREAKAAGVFLIGEQHGTADIPRLLRHLFGAAAGTGKDRAARLAYLMEVGPFSAQYAERRIRADAGLGKFFGEGKNRFALPFLFFREEAEVAREFIKASQRDAVLIGVDQEFVGAAGILAEILESEARTAQQQQAVQALKGDLAKDAFWLGNAKADTIERLRRAFSKKGTARAAAVITAITVSNEIYAPFMGRGGNVYEANYTREMLMRSYFIKAAGSPDEDRPQKIFGKFGATHAMRGRSLTEVPAFGNFLQEWATLNGFTFFNVLVDCDRGEVRNPQTGKAEPCKPVVDSERTPLRPAAMQGKAYVIDLRPLRRHLAKWTGLDRKTAQVIYGFDAYVVLPDVKPATLF